MSLIKNLLLKSWHVIYQSPEIGREEEQFKRRKKFENELINGISHVHSVLITGEKSSGKSYFAKRIIKRMVYMYSPDELSIVLIDPTGSEFSSFDKALKREYLHLAPINDSREGLHCLKELSDLSVKRTNEGAQRKKRILIYIDNSDLAMLDSAMFNAAIEKLLSNAERANMWLIYATNNEKLAADFQDKYHAVVAYKRLNRAYEEIGASPFAYGISSVRPY